MSLSDTIHETKDYCVMIGEMPAGELKGEIGYLIYNKRTDVIEGAVNVESAAIQIIIDEQANLEVALGRFEEDDASPQEDFQAVLDKLQAKDVT